MGNPFPSPHRRCSYQSSPRSRRRSGRHCIPELRRAPRTDPSRSARGRPWSFAVRSDLRRPAGGARAHFCEFLSLFFPTGFVMGTVPPPIRPITGIRPAQQSPRWRGPRSVWVRGGSSLAAMCLPRCARAGRDSSLAGLTHFRKKGAGSLTDSRLPVSPLLDARPTHRGDAWRDVDAGRQRRGRAGRAGEGAHPRYRAELPVWAGPEGRRSETRRSRRPRRLSI